ncbi:MAG: peptidylprolyl isomerase, partial [Hymenobacteraceae bacterium]|nr:peptidylprolyl isomerase [Hymenobacteraceae bacterium]MDX5395786.1 peptidylprolyl isomerase [Hymenobacteraceae bacterium]MDX5511841.1 peptidylprolyl isomerase [Hymenobacteraceae bacterium]
RDAAFRKADELAGTSSSLDEFRENVAKDNTIAKLEAKDIRNNAQNVNNLTGARELVRWAYSEKTNVGDVSPVFEVGDQFVVAVLTNKREKGYPAVADIREELTAAVRQEEKAKTIVGKLSGINGSLDEIAGKYGADAQVRTADEVVFANPFIPNLGMEPEAVGKTFGLKQGARTAPFDGQSGVLMVELLNLNKAAEPNQSNLVTLQQQIQGNVASKTENNVFEAIKENADIKDNRVRFF